MSEKIIGAKIQVDVGNSPQQVGNLKKETNELKDSLQQTGATVEGTNKTISKGSGNFSNLKDQLSSMPGPLGAVRSGVQTLNTAFKALLANPVVLVIAAIVGALMLLYKAFASTNDGADKLEQIMKGVGATIDVIRDRILRAGNAIVQFFKGNWKAALAEAKGAVSGFGAEVASEFKQAAAAMRELQGVEDTARALSVSRAKLNRDLAQARELITDENASLEEKRKALNMVREAEERQTKQELANAEKKLKAIKLQNSLSDTSDADLDKEAQAEADLYALQQKSAQDKRTMLREGNRIEREAAAESKARAQEAAAAQKEAYAKYIAFKEKLTSLHQENELLKIKDAHAKELKELEFKIENEKAANERAFKEGQLSREQFNQLEAALKIKADLEKQQLEEKHNKEKKEKEEAFQKELNDIRNKTMLAGITDARELERTQLEISQQEKINDALKRYSEDETKLAQVRAAIEEQFAAERNKMEERFRMEDEKKAFEAEEKRLNKISEARENDFEAARTALDTEAELFKAALDKKLLTEEEYTTKVEQLTEKRKRVAELETDFKKRQADEVAGTLGRLGDVIGKQTAVGKGLAMATALINTYQGASEALKQKSTLPSPFDVIAKVANVATVIATGLKTVKSIAAVNVPGGGGSAPVPSTDAPSAPIAPVAQSTRLDANSINSIGNVAQGGVNRQPLRAYVLGQDIEQDRDRNARLARAAVLGG